MIELVCTVCGGRQYTSRVDKATEKCIYCQAQSLELAENVEEETLKNFVRIHVLWVKVRTMSKTWVERRATPEQMLQDINDLKDLVVKSLFSGDPAAVKEVDDRVNMFLAMNNLQILDILADALDKFIGAKRY